MYSGAQPIRTFPGPNCVGIGVHRSIGRLNRVTERGVPMIDPLIYQAEIVMRRETPRLRAYRARRWPWRVGRWGGAKTGG